MQRRFTQVQEWDNQGLVIQRSAKSCERKSKAWLWSAVYLNEGPIASTSGQASGLYVLFCCCCSDTLSPGIPKAIWNPVAVHWPTGPKEWDRFGEDVKRSWLLSTHSPWLGYVQTGPQEMTNRNNALQSNTIIVSWQHKGPQRRCSGAATLISF